MSAKISDLSVTWNDAGTEFDAIKIDVGDTNSASTSKLLNLLIDGQSKMSVDKNGAITAAGGFVDAVLLKSPQDFGAKGDGITDDTAALQSWLEAGGYLYAPAGTYLVAGAGADAGGVQATISQSTTIDCADGAIFKAGTNLDNDIIRMACDTASFTDEREINITWRGGGLDQRLQRNSTSVPFSANFPPPNVGSSATADGISIRGDVNDGGTRKPGFRRVEVSGLRGVSSSTKHWESAGGDSGLFIDGTYDIRVHDCEFIGCRDLGFYGSGLSSGSFEGGSCIISNNRFEGCMFGASTKRLMSNVLYQGNVGINTAVVCIPTTVTGGGENIRVVDTIATGAWIPVRVTEHDNLVVSGTISHKHGHKMEDGSEPTLTFNANNAAVRLEGCNNCVVHDNFITGLNDGSTLTNVVAVRLSDDGSSGLSTYNIVRNNDARGVKAVVEEDSGEADFNVMRGNRGESLTNTEKVILDGGHSIDYDASFYRDNTAVTLNGSTDLTVLGSATIPREHFDNETKVVVEASGDFSNATSTKDVKLRVNSTVIGSPDVFDASEVGGWSLRYTIKANTASTQRVDGGVIGPTQARAAYAGTSVDTSTTDLLVEVVGQTSNTAGLIRLRTIEVDLVSPR